MRRIAAVLIMVCLATATLAVPPASAQELSQKKALVVEIGKLSSMDKVVTIMVDQIVPILLSVKLEQWKNDPRWPEIQPKVPKVAEIIKTTVSSVFLKDLDGYLTYSLEPAFSQMTIQELTEIRDAMATPAMQKWMQISFAKQPEIQARGQQWAARLMPQVERRIKEEMEKL